jgi:tetratricopeptide (TPR) repeat protein
VSAREMLEELAADGSLNADTQLALWSATKDEDREAATRAALAAVRLADANAPRNAYTAVADFLSGSDPLAGLDAFAARVEATGGVHGPLGSGYLRLAAVVGDVDRLSGAVDAILAGEDEVLADEVAVALSLGGRHEEAMALMEHAIRIDPAGPHWFAAPPLFAAAGQGSRLLALYERIAAERSGDSATALAAASVAMALGDRDRARYWIDRGLALDPQNLWILTRRGWWHEWNGDLEAARRDIERARPSGSPLIDESRERLDVLGEASPPLYAVCFVYAGYDLQRGWIPARTAESAAIEAGKAVGPWLAVAAALRTLAEYQPDRTVEWAERAAEEYPGNLAAQVGLAVVATGIETGGLDDSAAVARPALDAADGTDPDLTPCVHTVCGEILLREGSREEAADAFRRALDDPCMAPEWKARAEAGLQAASEPGDTE